jgi:hypothetical protein
VAIVGYEGSSTDPEPDAGTEEPFDAGSADGSVRRDGAATDATAADVTRPADAARSDAGRADGTMSDGALADGARLDGDAVNDAGAPERDAGPDPAVTTISAGGAFSCLSLDNGTLRCWGSNRNSELGGGEVNEGGATMVTVIASAGAAATNPLQNVRSVESGGTTSCAVLADRSVRCWGSNEHGALGVGTLTEQNGPVAVTW